MKLYEPVTVTYYTGHTYQCPNGHVYTHDNTATVSSHGRPHRRCRRCHRAADKAYRDRLRWNALCGSGYLAGKEEGRRLGYGEGFSEARTANARDWSNGYSEGYRRGWNDRNSGHGPRHEGLSLSRGPGL